MLCALAPILKADVVAKNLRLQYLDTFAYLAPQKLLELVGVEEAVQIELPKKSLISKVYFNFITF